MLWTIAQREFLDQFLSARFAVGLVLAASMTLGVTVIARQDYEQRLRDYNAAPKALEIKQAQRMVFHRPSPYSILSRGDEVRLGNRVNITHQRVPTRPISYSGEDQGSGSPEVQDPYSEAEVWAMDFAFVVKVVLSLLVLFLMYDAVAGENERGTLPLALSNSVGRSLFLAGKFVGGLLSALAVYVLCALLATLVMVGSPAVQVSVGGLARLTVIFGAGYLCLAAYCAGGLLVSSLFRRSAPALLVCILTWVLAVGLLPGVGIELARVIAPLPSPQERSRETEALRASLQQELRKVGEEMVRIKKGRIPQELLDRSKDLTVRSARLGYQVEMAYQNRMTRQRNAALMMTAPSPSAALDAAAGALAGTDVTAIDHFMKFARDYNERYGDTASLFKPKVPFQEQPEPFADAFGRVIGFLLVPAILSGVCFIVALRVFSRYEVRRV